MSGIEELRQRVMDAEKRFGLNDAQRAKYSERLIVSMNAVEERIREQQDQISQQAQEIETLQAAGGRKAEENEQLRAMLHSLLQAIETGGRDGLAEAMQELDRKASELVSTAAPEPVAEESDEQIEEPPVETAIAVGPVSVGPIEELEEPAAEEIAEEPAAEEIEEPAAEENAEPAAEEIEEPAAEEVAEPAAEEIAEPAAEEIEGEAPLSEENEEPAAEEDTEPVAEVEETAEQAVEVAVPDYTSEDAPEAVAETDGALPGGSLDEIMERVSKLVEETEAAAEEAPAEDSAKDSAEDSVEEIAEEPARQATGTDS